METKINVAAILESKPQGTKLYSLTYGDCSYQGYTGDFGIECQSQNGVQLNFDEYGKYCIEGECILFPSKEMRDWRKFAWKKGDILLSKDNDVYVIFEKFEDDAYTRFKGKHYLWKKLDEEDYSKEESQMLTSLFEKVNDYEAQTYINTIEERLGGKLNLETLEIEKAQPEFKDGDIVCILGIGYLAYGIVKSIDNSSKKLEYYVLNDMSTLKFEDWLSFEDKQIQPITETQQIILFDALAKEGKAWDAVKKQIVDLKPKIDELKPFDKVLVKDNPYGSWEPALFWKKVDVKDLHPYMIIGGKRYRYCEPYEGNEHLLDTN